MSRPSLPAFTVAIPRLLTLALLSVVATGHLAACGTCSTEQDTNTVTKDRGNATEAIAGIPGPPLETFTIDLSDPPKERASIRMPGPELEVRRTYAGLYVSSKGASVSVFLGGNMSLKELRQRTTSGQYDVIEDQTDAMIVKSTLNGKTAYFALMESNEFRCDSGWGVPLAAAKESLTVCRTLKRLPDVP